MKIRRDSISFCRLPLFAVLSGVVLLGLSSVGEVRADEVQTNAITTIQDKASTTTNDTSSPQDAGVIEINAQTCEITTEETIALFGCEGGRVKQITPLISQLADIDLEYWTLLTDTHFAEYPILADFGSLRPDDPLHRDLCGTATSVSSGSSPRQGSSTTPPSRYVVVNASASDSSHKPNAPSNNNSGRTRQHPPIMCSLVNGARCPNNGSAGNQTYRSPTLGDQLQGSPRVYICN